MRLFLRVDQCTSSSTPQPCLCARRTALYKDIGDTHITIPMPAGTPQCPADMDSGTVCQNPIYLPVSISICIYCRLAHYPPNPTDLLSLSIPVQTRAQEACLNPGHKALLTFLKACSNLEHLEQLTPETNRKLKVSQEHNQKKPMQHETIRT